MDRASQQKWFKDAYDLGEKRVETGYGWPLEVDSQLKEFIEIIKKYLSKEKF